MDADEAARRGAAVADAELKPSTFTSLSKGEVPWSVEDAKVALKGMRYEELESWLTSIGEKPSRAAQVFKWMYRRGKLAERVDEMEDVAAGFRAKLAGMATLEAGDGARSSLSITNALFFFCPPLNPLMRRRLTAFTRSELHGPGRRETSRWRISAPPRTAPRR
jgi:hypothetical protein